MRDNPRIAVTNLAAYNDGQLIFKWVDLPVDEDELEEVYESLKRTDLDEEFFISDYENFPFDVWEYDNMLELSNRVEEIEKLDDEEYYILEALLFHGLEYYESLKCVQDKNYAIYYDCYNMADVAVSVINNNYNLEEMMGDLANFFDYESYGDYLDIDGEFIKISYNKYVEVFR